MANRVPAKYRLLVGPYRLALWAVLCRFKGRCVNGFVDFFFDSQSQPEKFEFTAGHAVAIMRAHTHFNDAYRTFLGRTQRHEELLAQCMRDLVGQASVQDRVNLRKLDPLDASKARVGHLGQYLADTLALWSRLESKCASLVESSRPDELISFKAELYCAVAQSLWPYYGVVYARRKDVILPDAESPYNFCSWLPNADLFSVRFLPHTEVPSASVPNPGRSKSEAAVLAKLLLYPSITRDSLNDPTLVRFLDAASQAPFDYDTPHGAAGHVQVLANPTKADSPYHQLKRVFEHGLEAIESPFTDMFYFVNDVFRCILPRTEEDPTGVLFLATPCIDSLRSLLKVGDGDADACIAEVMRNSWNEVGGDIFSTNFHRDFAELRDDLFEAFEIQDRLSAYESIGHALKSLVAITGWRRSRADLRDAHSKLGGLLERGESSDQLRVISVAVENAYRSLGMFALPQSMGHFVRMAAAARDENWRKFNAWIDSEGDVRWSDANVEKICTHYSNSIFLVAECICLGFGWKRLIVDCKAALPESRHLTWEADGNPQGDFMRNLHFPPFKKGTDASYIFTFALTEPICNALTALVECSTYETNLPAAMDLALRIKVSPVHEAKEILVRVENESLEPAPVRIPGLEHTRRMLDDFDFVTFGEKINSVPIGNSLYRISSEVRFRPFELYEKLIAEAGD